MRITFEGERRIAAPQPSLGAVLAETELPFVNPPWLQAYFTPPEQHSPEMKETLRCRTSSSRRSSPPTTS